LGEECGSAAVLFEQSALFLDALPVRKAFLSAIQTDLSCTPLVHNSLCLDVFILSIIDDLSADRGVNKWDMLKTCCNFPDQFRKIGAAEAHKRSGNAVMFHIRRDMLVMRIAAL
jgi:hypothetical protein